MTRRAPSAANRAAVAAPIPELAPAIADNLVHQHSCRWLQEKNDSISPASQANRLKFQAFQGLDSLTVCSMIDFVRVSCVEFDDNRETLTRDEHHLIEEAVHGADCLHFNRMPFIRDLINTIVDVRRNTVAFATDCIMSTPAISSSTELTRKQQTRSSWDLYVPMRLATQTSHVDIM